MCPNDDSPILTPTSRFHTLSMMISSSSSSSSSSQQQSHQQRKQDQDHQNQINPQQPHDLSGRPRRPSQVQTSFQSQSSLPSTGPASAISSSTMPSPISQLGSPVLSPNPATLAASSPEHSGRESEEQFPPAPFHLPESVLLSKKVSSGSLGGAAKSSNSSSAGGGGGPTTPASNQGSLIRRLSSRASRMTQRRRPSATAQSSRDASVGPNIMRRRSDSNTGPGYALLTDSDSDIPEADELLLAGQAQEPPFSATSYISAGSFACSAAGAASAGTQASSASSAAHLNCAPTIPARLREGTSMRKVSKKNKAKDICLQLQIESYSDKISWDKTRPNKCLHIDDIREIRKGSDIRQYRLDFGFPEPDEPRWFSIIYAVGGAGAGARAKNNKTMHLIAPDDDTFRDWTETLDAIARHRQFAMIALMNFTEDAVREFWLREHADDSEELDFAGIERVCRNLHINASSLLLRAALEMVDSRRTGRLNFEGFRQFIRHLNTRADVNRIYLQVAQDPGRGITAPEFLHFLRHQQREDVDSAVFQWETVFSQFASRFPVDARDGVDQDRDSDANSLLTTGGRGELRMSDVAFASYLTSSENSPIREPPAECRLDRPMNEYFISSSHNTYLLGRQVYGQSTVEGYISALVQGCRCVEIDCWDGPNGLPVVNHGRTFTTAISFQEAITTINKYAFHKSRLPLWISFEVHCSPPQQAVMATIIKATFGARLVTEPLETTSADSTTLPSPSELIDRILIKVKQASATATTTMAEAAAAAIETTTTTTTTRRRGASLGSASQQQPAIVQELAGISQSVPQSPLLSPSGGGATTSAPAPAPSRRLAPAAVARRFGSNSSGNNNNSNITSAPGEGDLGGSASPSDTESGTERTSFATHHHYFLHHTNSNNSTNSTGKDSNPAPPARRYHQKSVTAKIIKPLGDLGVYCAGVKFKGFDAAEAKLFNHIFSFVESSFAKYSRSREERKALDWHNMRFLMRVYPNQTRVMSDNFDPLLYWRRGVQMAALNWQTFDLGVQLNRAMFEGGTDSSGYVLKPRELREIQVMPDGWLGKRERKSVSFSIDVISARQLIRPSSLPAGKQMNPYVEVEVFHASDRRDKKESISTTLDALDAAAAADTPLRFQTHVVTDNGFNPTWWTGGSGGGGGGPDSDGKKRSSFNVRLTTKYPDLIFIRWTVRLAHSSEPYAVFTAKLANLKQGYRTLPLLSPATGDQYLFSTLFCRINVDPIQKVLLDYPGDRQPDNSYKLRGLGRTVFARASSPKPSMEKTDS